MGGFQLFERSDQPTQLVGENNNHVTGGIGRFVRILEFNDVLQNKLETIIPFTTEEEIKDRGKSDGISNLLCSFRHRGSLFSASLGASRTFP